MNKNALIVGASSGIGFYIVKYLLEKKYKILGTYNKKKINKDLHIKNQIKVDLTKKEQIKFLIKKISNYKFDLVIFLTAITPNSLNNKNATFGNFEIKKFEKFNKINCFSLISVFESLVLNNLLKKGSKIIFFSSTAGSIYLRGKAKFSKKFGNLFYRLSKTSLNCAVKNFSYDFKNKFIINAIHPGLLNVGSGKSNKGRINPEKRIKKIISTIMNLNFLDSGNFIDYKGKTIQW